MSFSALKNKKERDRMNLTVVLKESGKIILHRGYHQ